MNLKQVVILVVLIVSLVANAWLVNERLEEKFYTKGVTDGQSQLVNKVIAQVEKTGQLTVTLPSGRQIPMVAQQQQQQPQKPGLGQIFGGLAAAKASAAPDPNGTK